MGIWYDSFGSSFMLVNWEGSGTGSAIIEGTTTKHATINTINTFIVGSKFEVSFDFSLQFASPVSLRPGSTNPCGPTAGDPLSRSYGVKLPSSLTTVLSSALGYSPCLPVSVSVRSRPCMTSKLFSAACSHRFGNKSPSPLRDAHYQSGADVSRCVI